MAKPFLKWAGGKRQLLDEISSRFPDDLEGYSTYVEPFVGGGAVLFHLLEKHDFDEVHIFDINPELTLCYEMLKDSAEKVWNQLNSMINEYPSQDTDEQKEYYYSVRQAWNDGVPKLEKMSKPNKIKRLLKPYSSTKPASMDSSESTARRI